MSAIIGSLLPFTFLAYRNTATSFDNPFVAFFTAALVAASSSGVSFKADIFPGPAGASVSIVRPAGIIYLHVHFLIQMVFTINKCGGLLF
jgi:hypothetical protein